MMTSTNPTTGASADVSTTKTLADSPWVLILSKDARSLSTYPEVPKFMKGQIVHLIFVNESRESVIMGVIAIGMVVTEPGEDEHEVNTDSKYIWIKSGEATSGLNPIAAGETRGVHFEVTKDLNGPDGSLYAYSYFYICGNSDPSTGTGGLGILGGDGQAVDPHVIIN